MRSILLHRPGLQLPCDHKRSRMAILFAGLLVTLSACSTPLTPEQKAAEIARAQNGIVLFQRGCLATNARAKLAIAYFRSQGMTQQMTRVSNATGVHAPDLSNGAIVASFSFPGVDGRSCSVIMDDVSQEVAASSYYALTRTRQGDESGISKAVPYGITAAGQLPRFKPDGTFESISFQHGLNVDTGKKGFILSYVVGKTTLPLRELADGALLPSPPQIGTKSQ